jgi:hypothetical protein
MCTVELLISVKIVKQKWCISSLMMNLEVLEYLVMTGGSLMFFTSFGEHRSYSLLRATSPSKSWTQIMELSIVNRILRGSP